MPHKTLFIHDPSAILDYTIDWLDWLGTDTIATSVWSIDYGSGGTVSDLTIQSNSNTTTSATVWLKLGVVGRIYGVRNRIVTTSGRTEDCTIEIAVENK